MCVCVCVCVCVSVCVCVFETDKFERLSHERGNGWKKKLLCLNKNF